MKEMMQYFFDDSEIISIVDFSLNEFNNCFLSLHTVTLTFVADQDLLGSLTFNTKRIKRIRIKMFMTRVLGICMVQLSKWSWSKEQCQAIFNKNVLY